MKVEDPPAFLVQWFYHKHKVLPKGDESSWKNYTKYAARNATTKQTFIAMEKMPMVIKSIYAKSVALSGLRKRRPKSETQITRSAPSAAKPCICTIVKNIMTIIPAATKNADILSSHQSLLPFPLHPCQNSLERRILSGCAIRSM